MRNDALQHVLKFGTDDSVGRRVISQYASNRAKLLKKKKDVMCLNSTKERRSSVLEGPNRGLNAGPRAIIMHSIPKRESYH